MEDEESLNFSRYLPRYRDKDWRGEQPRSDMFERVIVGESLAPSLYLKKKGVS